MTVIRFGVALAYVGTTIATGVCLKNVWLEFARPSQFTSIQGSTQYFGCASGQSTDSWSLFVPVTVMYSIVYVATVASAMREWYWGRKSALMHRILRE